MPSSINMTAEQVREKLQLKSVRTVHRIIKRGDLEAFSVSGEYRITGKALREYVAKKTVKRDVA